MFPFLFIYVYVCMSTSEYVHVSVGTCECRCLWWPEDVRSPGSGLYVSCVMWVLGLNSGALQEQYILLTAGASVYPNILFIYLYVCMCVG